MSLAMSQELTILNNASRLLAEARSIDDVKAIRDKAEAVRAYAKAAQLGLKMQNRAAELKLRAERKAGSFLAILKLKGGDRRSKAQRGPLKLGELGITRHQSTRWQLVASVPDGDFDRFIQAKTDLGEEITAAGVNRLARELKQTKKRPPPLSCSNPEPVKTIRVAGDRSSAPVELLDELRNHRQLLADVLRPLYSGGEMAFEPAARRVVGLLLSEIDTLLAQLERELHRSKA